MGEEHITQTVLCKGIRIKVGQVEIGLDEKCCGWVKFDGVEQRGITKMDISLVVGEPATMTITRFMPKDGGEAFAIMGWGADTHKEQDDEANR